MTDVVIVGAGPVGLFLALKLGLQGLEVLVLEKKLARTPGSNAIGVTPPSLELLAGVGVSQELIARGACIRDVFVHGEKEKNLGQVTFSHLTGSYPYILAVPQRITEEVLENALEKLPRVTINYGWEFESVDQDDDAVTALFLDPNRNPRCERASFLVGCDGAKSSVRTAVGQVHRPRKASATFLMGDFADHTGWGDEAHLFFTPRGACESFPLGRGQRRWIVQTNTFLDEPGTYLEEEVEKRTGIVLSPGERSWMSPFGIHRWISPRYDFGRVFLTGDAAHQMSPIGGQGMNTGFADADLLTSVLVLLQKKQAEGGFTDEEAQRLGRHYTRARRLAGKSAAKRADFSMAVGTVRGGGSFFRNLFLTFFLNGFLKNLIPPHYAMLTIPRKGL